MTKRQRLHKKLIKFQNRSGKVEGKSIWAAMNKELKNAASS